MSGSRDGGSQELHGGIKARETLSDTDHLSSVIVGVFMSTDPKNASNLPSFDDSKSQNTDNQSSATQNLDSQNLALFQTLIPGGHHWCGRINRHHTLTLTSLADNALSLIHI